MSRAWFEFRVYQRSFRQPLHTHYGVWACREGILLKLHTAEGARGYGEIAPLAWFGSESLAQALGLCRQLPNPLTHADIQAIPDAYPACQFGWSMAWEALTPRPDLGATLPRCSLLPTGATALAAWRSQWNQGYRTFKWKIGVTDHHQELAWLEQLLDLLPATAQLRLDANGGLTEAEAREWLSICDRKSQIEYLEQPLPPDQWEGLLRLATSYSTPVALDESVATVAHLANCYRRGWRGVVVVKPAIAGFPDRLRQLCHRPGLDPVFSSVFETAIGHQAGLQLAHELSQRPTGFGTPAWFPAADPLSQPDPDDLWQHLSTSSPVFANPG